MGSRRAELVTLKLWRARWRACWILLTSWRSFSPAATYFLSTATRSRQEAPPRSLRAGLVAAGCDARRSQTGEVRQQQIYGNVKSTPPLTPPARGGGFGYGEACAFDVASDVLPRLAAPSIAGRGGIAARRRGRGRDADAFLYRPRMACTKSPPRPRSTGNPLIALLLLR